MKTSISNYKRVFLIEPNLKKAFGHVSEFPFILRNYLKQQNLETYIIGNKNIDPDLFEKHQEIIPLIKQGCFDDLADQGISFSKDLSSLHLRFNLNKEDLIIILTSYSNQVMGVADFLNKNSFKQNPTFCIWFHQLYPPTEEFEQTLQDKFQEKIQKRLTTAFSQIKNQQNIYLFTTLSQGLRQIYSNLAQTKVTCLPSIFDFDNTPIKDNANKQIKIGFLGDGRREKGLPIILDYLEKYKHSDNFIIQDIFPRGYSSSELEKTNKQKKYLANNFSNVELIKNPLSSEEYKKLLCNLDVILLPYHPGSYDNRVSGIFFEAVINNKLVISTNGTWVASQINQYNNGVLFNYSDGSRGLSDCINQLHKNFSLLKTNAEKIKFRFKQKCSAANFVRQLTVNTN